MQASNRGLGAAGFHNAMLYEALRASIAPLVALLQDEEDKTRANAAGALGNLVRNSPLLTRQLLHANALQVRNMELHTVFVLSVSNAVCAQTPWR